MEAMAREETELTQRVERLEQQLKNRVSKRERWRQGAQSEDPTADARPLPPIRLTEEYFAGKTQSLC